MRCRKAHWYLSARCDGTLSERQRLRLEAHLTTCEGCRREAFYFSELGTVSIRLESHAPRPDFDLRLRSAIRRADEAALAPVSWQSRFANVMLRPALVASSVVVLGLGGLGTWSLMQGAPVPLAKSPESSQAVSPRYGLAVTNGQPTVPATGELIPVDGHGDEAQRLQARYLEAGQLPRDYVLEAVRLDNASFDSSAPRYVLPTVSPDQVAKKVSY